MSFRNIYNHKINSIYRLIFIFVLAIALTGLMTRCSESTTDENGNGNGGNNTVIMKNITFNPQVLNVSVGATVTWKNNDNVNHTVTGGTPNNVSGIFMSDTLAPGDSFQHTFSDTGTFVYFCRFHPVQMTGTIFVGQTDGNDGDQEDNDGNGGYY